MKKSPQLIYVLLFAFVITAAIVIAFIRPGYKYGLDIYEKYSTAGRSSRSYADLDGDGNTDMFTRPPQSPNITSIIVYNSNEEILNQFNFRGKFPNFTEPFYGDYDADGLLEIYLFTHIDDSLFLNIVEPYNISEPYICNRFIDIAPLEEGESTYRILSFLLNKHTDPNNCKMYFSVSAGLKLTPRHIYSYDVKKDELIKSPFSGNSIAYNLESFDIDGDGTIELYGFVGAPGNYHTPVPYSDQSTWLMIYSHELEYEFEPVEFKEFPARLNTYPILDERENKWAVIFQYNGIRKDIESKLMLYSLDGMLLKSINLDSLGFMLPFGNFIQDNSLYIHDGELGLLVKYNKDLEEELRIQSDKLKGGLYGPFDMGPKHMKIICIANNNSINLLDMKGRRLTEESFDGRPMSLFRPVKVENYRGFTGYQLNTSEFDYLFDIVTRKRWLWFSLKVSGIFVFVFWMVFLIQFIQIRQEIKRKTINNKLREYQLIAIKRQIDPHFIFNALNAISSMNLKGDIEGADEYLGRFSSLMREVLESSDESIVPLSNEMNLINKYLALEQLRFGSNLKYTIDLPENCMEIQVPSMSVHTFVENAIKHGLAAKKGEKILAIRAALNMDVLKIEIEDNGNGFGEKSKSTYSNGKGYEIVRKMFYAFHQLTGRKISFTKSEPTTGGAIVSMTIEI